MSQLGIPNTSYLHGGYHNALLQEIQSERVLLKSNLMYPLFICDDPDTEEEISSLPGQKQWGLNKLGPFLDTLVKKGLKSVILFGILKKIAKDPWGTDADTERSPVVQGTKFIREHFPTLTICCDVCLCEYTSHGHCGIFTGQGSQALGGDNGIGHLRLDNEKTVKRLTDVALNYAKAGAHIVAPSDMSDGRIGVIKRALIDAGLENACSLMAYSAKFSSDLYGPFRDAAGGAPQFGDRKAYQLPAGARGLASRSIIRDTSEGADFIMIKPGILYLDVISEARHLAPHHPLAVYHVSGEYATLVAGAAAGIYDLKRMTLETMNSFLRAGVHLIVTYSTPDLLDWLDN